MPNAITPDRHPTLQVAVVGNSFEIAEQFPNQLGGGWPILASLMGEGKWEHVANAAVAGQDMIEYVAQFDTHVAPVAATVNTLIIGGAENDIAEAVAAGKSVAVAVGELRAALTTLVTRARAHGLRPVIRTTAPHFNSGSRQHIAAWNVWVKSYGAREGIPVLDFHNVLVDRATGNYKAGYSAEGAGGEIHPNATSTPLLAQHAVAVLTAGVQGQHPGLGMTASDPGQLTANPLFMSLSGSTPNNWSLTVPTGCTQSIVTDPLVPGNMVRFDCAATASVGQMVGPSSGAAAIDATDVSAGDVIEWTQIVTSDGGIHWTAVLAFYRSAGGNQYHIFNQIKPAITRAVIKRRLVVPSDVTLLQPQMSVQAGTGTVDFGHPSIRNLTREGLV